jgi:hypothetical protein
MTVCLGCASLGLLSFPREINGVQNPQSIEIVVIDPRPMAAAVLELETRFGWRVTYEDPRFAHADDMEDVTSIVRKDGDLSKTVMIPKGGLLVFRPDVAATSSPRQMLESLLETYVLSGHPGRFALAESPGYFHVIPAAIRDSAGRELLQDSVLASPVSLTLVDRSLNEIVGAVLDQVEAVTGQTFGMGGVGNNLMLQTRVRLGADNEPANSVLARVFAAVDIPLSWRLFYSPGRSDSPGIKDYHFNITTIRPPQ